MNFFLELNWKFTTTLTIFYALFVLSCLGHASSNMISTNKKLYDSIDYATGNNTSSSMQSRDVVFRSAGNFKQEINSYGYDKAEVQTEKERLRECLANVLLNAEKKEKAQEKALLSVAGALSNDNYEGFGSLVNLDLLKTLKNNTAEGDKLIGKILAFCKYMNDEISNLKVSNEEKVKLKVRIDELKLSAENFGLLVSQSTEKEVQHRNCRILDVSDHLQVVVISAGFLDGIRPGLVLNVIQADNAVIKVIAVRPFVSATVVIEGKLGKISPGMSVKFRKV